MRVIALLLPRLLSVHIVFLRRRTGESERGKGEWQEWHCTALPQSCLSCLPPSSHPERAHTSNVGRTCTLPWHFRRGKHISGLHAYPKGEKRVSRGPHERLHRGRGRLVRGRRQRAAGALVAHFSSTSLSHHHTRTIPNSHVSEQELTSSHTMSTQGREAARKEGAARDATKRCDQRAWSTDMTWGHRAHSD